MSSSGALITLASLVNSEEISRETLVVCKKTPMRRVSHVTRPTDRETHERMGAYLERDDQCCGGHHRCLEIVQIKIQKRQSDQILQQCALTLRHLVHLAEILGEVKPRRASDFEVQKLKNRSFGVI